jgi:hypothetical protein
LSSLIRAVEAVKAVRAQKLRSKSKVDHTNTKTTQLAEEIAQKTTNELQTIIQEIQKTVQKNPTISINELREKFKVRVGSILAQAVRESYFAGYNFVERFAGRTIQLTPQNLFDMDRIIDIYIKSFWNNVSSNLDSHQETKLAGVLVGASAESIFSKLVSFLNNMAISLAYSTLGRATVSATVQNFNDAISSRTTIPRLTDPLLNTRPEFNPPFSSELLQPIRPLLIWVSERDNRVCPICQNLDGRTFDGNDYEIPLPGPEEHGGSTHWGCRCRLLPLDGEKVYNG